MHHPLAFGMLTVESGVALMIASLRFGQLQVNTTFAESLLRVIEQKSPPVRAAPSHCSYRSGAEPDAAGYNHLDASAAACIILNSLLVEVRWTWTWWSSALKQADLDYLNPSSTTGLNHPSSRWPPPTHTTTSKFARQQIMSENLRRGIPSRAAHPL